MGTLASLRNLSLPSPSPYRSPRWALLRAWLPTFFWMGVIAFESTSVFTSEHTQGWVYAILRFVLGAHIAGHIAPLINEYGRKVGHFTGYSILGALSFFAWTELLAYVRANHLAKLGKAVQVMRRWHLRAAVLAVTVVFIVASCDEFHQSFVPGRGPSFHDVLLDTMGGIFAQIMILLFWKGARNERLKPQPALEAETGTRV